MDQARRGKAALDARDYDEAIKQYTEAISTNSSAVDYYIKRSTAYHRASNFTAALSDAEIAVQLGKKRAKREFIKDAQFRRAQTLFSLERYGDAEFVLGLVKKLDEKDKSLLIWETKMKQKLDALAEDDEKRKVTVEETPSVGIPTMSKMKKESGTSVAEAQVSDPVSSWAVRVPEKPEVVQTPPSKIKHDWYQNNQNVYFTLLAKGVPKDKATIDIKERALAISFPTLDATYEFTLDPLYAPIDATSSVFNITTSKIEVTLKKTNAGVKWPSLESTEPVVTSEDADSKVDPIKRAILQSRILKDRAPAYPTSSRSGPKDWDKVASDLTRKPKKDKAGDDSKGFEEDDLDGGDDVNKFFKTLYAGADPDTRRAMMKSYQESNGTALSTNWSEVSQGPVETSPPEGMEARKWGQ